MISGFPESGESPPTPLSSLREIYPSPGPSEDLASFLMPMLSSQGWFAEPCLPVASPPLSMTSPVPAFGRDLLVVRPLCSFMCLSPYFCRHFWALSGLSGPSRNQGHPFLPFAYWKTFFPPFGTIISCFIGRQAFLRRLTRHLVAKA